jgi:membrane associated rhomboid family serine protease
MAYRTPSFSFGYGLTPWVKNLIIANTVIWVATYLLGFRQLTAYMAFVPGDILFRPWTLLTYMFAHGGFMHLFFNMLGLFFFGPPLEARWGSKEFLKFYLICGLGGAALSFVFMDNPVIGASAAVYGVMLAFAMNWPDMPIYIWGIFPVPAKFLVLILALFSFVSAFSGSGGNVAHFAHLGGFAAAWLYLKYDRGRHKLFSGMRQKSQRRKFTVVPGDRAGGGGRNVQTDVTAKPTPTPRPARGGSDDQILDELDRVLEKISTDGLASLTIEERRLLDDVSRRYRQN